MIHSSDIPVCDLSVFRLLIYLIFFSRSTHTIRACPILYTRIDPITVICTKEIHAIIHDHNSQLVVFVI